MPTTDKTAQDAQAVTDLVAGWPAPYQQIGARLHETIMSAGPRLKPRLWYGMPGYATGRSTPVLVFFRLDGEVMSFGLSEKATVERERESTLRPSAWFLDEIDERTLEKVAALVRTAFS